MQTSNEFIVIAWVKRLDNAADLAQRLGAGFHPIYFQLSRRRLRALVPIRYFFQSLMTWQILLKRKPAVIHVTNPPIFAALNVYLYCQLSGAKFLISTHSPALYSRKWGWSVPLLRFLARAALVNIVDQERYQRLFESWGARAIILAKRPRAYALSGDIQEIAGGFPITVVNTFAPDEPVEPILSAARQLPDVRFYILGDFQLADPAILSLAPSNVMFTGFLPHDEYWEQLKSSRAVMSLTTYPYSLLAGGTDGMSVGKPLILSSQPALTEYFTKGAIFIDNTSNGIVTGVREMQRNEICLRQDIVELANEKRQRWETSFQELLRITGEARRQISLQQV